MKVTFCDFHMQAYARWGDVPLSSFLVYAPVAQSLQNILSSACLVLFFMQRFASVYQNLMLNFFPKLSNLFYYYLAE